MATPAGQMTQKQVSTDFSVHEECKIKCRSSIILPHIDRYPETLSLADDHGYLPLHTLLWNKSSPIELVLTLIEKYRAALQHKSEYGYLPIHVECKERCVSKCIELYSESLSIGR
jgi:hypothetical protein